MVEKVKTIGTFSPQTLSVEVEVDNEDELVSLACSGSQRAFERLVRKYQDMVYRLAFRFFGNQEDALDAAQEVYLKAFRGIKSFQGRSSFKTWIYRITSNTCLTISEEKQKQKKSIIKSIFDWFSRPPVSDPAKTVVDREYQMELQKAIQEKIAKIPEVYRLPVILKDIEGKSLEEISEILEIKEGTVKSRINRGRRLLQESLEPFYRGMKKV